jgi:uncharacterized protein YsxB (DUF464 family)
MVEIRLEKNKMNINGHAQYAEYGKDIVCSAVSILAATFINLYDVTVVEDEPFNMELEWKKADTEFIEMGFEILAETYPKNIKIIKE